MQINPSWDLFVIVFFAIIIAYSVIVGRNMTLKIMIACYIAILTADGIGNMINRYFIGDDAFIKALDVSNAQESLIVIKILIFVLTIVLISLKGRFSISTDATGSSTMDLLLTLVYGILCAGLVTSTITLYASGTSLVQESGVVMNEAVATMYRESFMVAALVNNYNLIFSLPAIVFVVASMATEGEA